MAMATPSEHMDAEMDGAREPDPSGERAAAVAADTPAATAAEGEQDMKHSFKLLLSMKKEPGALPLYFKSDGQRFPHEKTIKLNALCQYRLDLSFTPPRVVTSVTFNGGALDVHEVTRDSTASAFSCHFHTHDFEPTKKGHRREVPIILTLADLGQLTLAVQFKCYERDNVQHSEWGSNLHCIEYLCQETKHLSNVEIVSETFR